MDLSKIRGKLASIQKSTTKANNSKEFIFSPPEGETTIRIVPLKSNPDWAFFEAYFHYNFNKRTFISPISFGQPDPIHQFASELQESANSKEEWVQGKKLEPKLRIYAPVLIRGRENEGVQFWGFGQTIYESLLKLMDDDDYGDITNLKTGTDIVIDRKTAEQAGNDFGETTIRPKRNPSPVAPDDKLEEVIGLIKNQVDLSEVPYFTPPSYDEIKIQLDKYLKIDDPATPEVSGFGTSTTAIPSKPAPSKGKPKSSEEVFDNIFGEE